jgi:hypothetical protein
VAPEAALHSRRHLPHSLAAIRQSGSNLVIRPLFNSQPHFTRRRLCGSLVFLTPYLTSFVDD